MQLVQAGDTYTTVMLSCYRPQWSWGKVMFLHMSVILFMGGGVWADPLGADPTGADPLGTDTPWADP